MTERIAGEQIAIFGPIDNSFHGMDNFRAGVASPIRDALFSRRRGPDDLSVIFDGAVKEIAPSTQSTLTFQDKKLTSDVLGICLDGPLVKDALQAKRASSSFALFPTASTAEPIKA